MQPRRTVTMTVVELNGFDETGIVGRYLRFTRVALRSETELRPFVYNLLHFGSVTTTKNFLNGMPDGAKVNYVRMILADQAIDVDQYVFSSDHQIDVLRQFSMLEAKALFRKRGELLVKLQNKEADNAVSTAVEYLKRFERSPYWMEAFMKSYGFRMIVEDLKNTSRVLRNPGFPDYLVVSMIDGGFPFVFWWQSFLISAMLPTRFSLDRTPIYGVTKGDEYYPLVSMAGNIAYITSTVAGMMYPHAVKELPRMRMQDLNAFHDEYAQRASTPKFLKRALFVGGINPDLQYTVPYLLYSEANLKAVYEPFRLQWKSGGTLRSFYRSFGKYPSNDLVVIGKTNRLEDKEIVAECEGIGLECKQAGEFFDDYAGLCDDIVAEAKASNLSRDQILKVQSAVERSIHYVKNSLKA